MTPINVNSKIYVAGHRGMVGYTIVRHLSHNGFNQVRTKSRDEKSIRFAILEYDF